MKNKNIVVFKIEDSTVTFEKAKCRYGSESNGEIYEGLFISESADDKYYMAKEENMIYIGYELPSNEKEAKNILEHAADPSDWYDTENGIYLLYDEEPDVYAVSDIPGETEDLDKLFKDNELIRVD